MSRKLLLILSPNTVHLWLTASIQIRLLSPLRENPEVLLLVALVVVADLDEEEQGADVVAHHVHP